MATRLVLSSGATFVSSWPLLEARVRVIEGCVDEIGAQVGFFLDVPLLVSDGDVERMAYVRPSAIDALEPVGVVVPTGPLVERAESRRCRQCGRRIEPGQAYIPQGPYHVSCEGAR